MTLFFGVCSPHFLKRTQLLSRAWPISSLLSDFVSQPTVPFALASFPLLCFLGGFVRSAAPSSRLRSVTVFFLDVMTKLVVLTEISL